MSSNSLLKNHSLQITLNDFLCCEATRAIWRCAGHFRIKRDSYISLEERVPEKHPLRDIRELVRAVLVDMNRDVAALYSDEGRPSIFPEQLVRALSRRFGLAASLAVK